MENHTFTTEDGRELKPYALLADQMDEGLLQARCAVYLDGKTVLYYEEIPRLNQAIAIPTTLFGPDGSRMALSSWAPVVTVGLSVTVEFSAYASSEDTTND